MKKTITKMIAALFGLILIAAAVVIFGSLAPGDFPQGVTVTIEKGSTIADTADELFEKGIIRSTTLFKAYVRLIGTAGIQTGNYFFGASESVLRIASRMVKGQLGVPKIKVTIPEGLASPDVARAIKRSIPTFDDKGFLALARPLEGYLFPDTYFFDKNTTPEDAIEAMRSNFDEQTRGLRIPKQFADKTFKEILIMASIVEEEANIGEDRRIIAGILWKRIETGMPLQVDAPFFYVLGKTSAELTRADLAMDSPYNLYRNKGLPPTPIDNPGLGAITDTINAISTEYWFFLSDATGRTHFAETHDEHVANKVKYLN